MFGRINKRRSNRPPWQEPREIWSNQVGFDDLNARLDRIEELWPRSEYVMRDRITGQHWLLKYSGQIGDKVGPSLRPISWPIVAHRHRQTWMDRLIDFWQGPPWVRPRNVWKGDKHFQALSERLEHLRDINLRESLHRDRETDLLWRLRAIDGGGDMYPGIVDCYEPVKGESEFR